VVTQGHNGGSKPVEESLVEHVCQGQWLDLIPDVPKHETIDEATMRSWGDSQTCPASVIRDILLGRLAADPDPHGLRLRGARISGRLDLGNLITDVNLELEDCFLEEGVLAADARLRGFGLDGCQIEHPAEPPIDGAGLTCSVLRLDGARVIGHTKYGAVHLIFAHIGDTLDCTGAEVRNDSGPALAANGMQVGQISLRLGFTATCSTEFGAIMLTGANIGRVLDCSGAKLRNDSGPALAADGLQVGQTISLADGFTATCSTELGAIMLTGANIGGILDCTEAELWNDSGPALVADGLQVGQTMFLCGGFTATGNGDEGAVNLAGARIGTLNCDVVTVRNDSGPALAAQRLQVADMLLSGGFTGGGENVTVDLRGVRVAGRFGFGPAQVEHKFNIHNGFEVELHRRLDVDGLTYAGVPWMISRQQSWLEWLQNGTPYYAAQPYQQLAAGYRALGDDRKARETLMAQRDDQLTRIHTSRWEQLWGRITKVTLGYGYQPWRALWFLAGVVAVSCVLAVVLGVHSALAQTSQTTTPGRSCTLVQQISVGLDLNLPVGTTVARVDCNLTTDSGSVTAAWLTAIGWVLRVLAWGFAALFIAGFTSAVRKT
jgi:hypothetical protein